MGCNRLVKKNHVGLVKLVFSKRIIVGVYRRALWFILYHLPLKIDPKKIVFSAYESRGYSDNSKALIDEIVRRDFDVKLKVISDRDLDISSKVEKVRPYSFSAVYNLTTACIWVDNIRKPAYVRKRPGQYYIQTWHGFPIKRVENDVVGQLTARYVRAAKNDSMLCDLMISNSAFLTNLYNNSFWYDKRVLACGFPRNDVLVNIDKNTVLEAKKSLGLNVCEQLALYAPTFRKAKNFDVFDLDFTKIIDSLQRKFGGVWRMGVRVHPNMATSFKVPDRSVGVLDLSHIYDGQELLVGVDVLITDYSSIMFDYMLTRRPCFLYIPDYDEYAALDRGFYYPIAETPFDICSSPDGLVSGIENFDLGGYLSKISRFESRYGFVRNQFASVEVTREIMNYLSHNGGATD